MMKTALLITIVILCFNWTSQFSDELDHHYDKTCDGEDKLPCASGGCFHLLQHCDGNYDCVDGTDESFCVSYQATPEPCNISHEFPCADGVGCIPKYMMCNNYSDCDDGSDELNCTDGETVNKDKTCKGFECGDGKCISILWACDGRYDCNDKSDETSFDLCRHTNIKHFMGHGGGSCGSVLGETTLSCNDSSFCIPRRMMCDGIMDCRDGSDEGPFCAQWTTMCDKVECHGNGTKCVPDRHGPTCLCPQPNAYKYNNYTHVCEDINECLLDQPECQQKCVNEVGSYHCQCDPGYVKNRDNYLCFAPEPEAMMFFSTANDIRSIKIKSKQMVTVATDIKQAHGVSYDGTYVYWMDTAQGHQAIFKAHLNDVQNTKQVLVSIGLEEPGDIAVDYLGGNFYFSDSERGTISACKTDGSICSTMKMQTSHPKYVTLDVAKGNMYWADWHEKSLIMTARMDGSQSKVLVEHLVTFPTGLTVDSPNERLYYVDRIIHVISLDGKRKYSLYDEPFHHPYFISVFENTIFWSEWTTNSIQIMDKLRGPARMRNTLLTLETAILGMHMYHPVLMNSTLNPCSNNSCSHFCFVISNVSHVCGCPDGFELNNNVCVRMKDYRPNYLVVGGGQLFTRIQYDQLGNPETHATHFDIGRVHAMAYDSFRDLLYVYDVFWSTIESISMTDFPLGVTERLLRESLVSVVDLDHDYATDNLYILDAGRSLLEAYSLKTQKRAPVYKFHDYEKPISMCVLPDYGKLMVAIIENEKPNIIHIDSMGLDGQNRKHIITHGLRGPHVRLRYVQHMDSVFISDESSGIIDYMHPDGTGKESYHELTTTINSLAITENYVFWTDRRTSRLFWSDVHDTTQKIRRMDLALFPNDTQLLILATSKPPEPSDPLLRHPCLKSVCSDVCVQMPHEPHPIPILKMNYTCLCPPGFVLEDRHKCNRVVHCTNEEIVCHRSNMCVKKEKRCDGVKDCRLGEDEEGCKPVDANNICTPDEFFCRGVCLNKKVTTLCDGKPFYDDETRTSCNLTEYQCAHSKYCIPRNYLCDHDRDCPEGDDEDPGVCDTMSCDEWEFMCASGSCIMKGFICDGEDDCRDGSDEVNCENFTCPPGQFKCENKNCIDIHKRCDGQQDCLDLSDEEGCEEPIVTDVVEATPVCEFWEYRCEHNSSLCLPVTTRCNGKVECPGGTDEHGCHHYCDTTHQFKCLQENVCIDLTYVCNDRWDCGDGSDETPEACAKVNLTSNLFPSIPPCDEGFRCKNGQCIEWYQVCDNSPDCFDGSDENGQCGTSCTKNKCAFDCLPTPTGPRCLCPLGFDLGHDQITCEDVDECKNDICSQICVNMMGTYRCGCHQGFVPRIDRHSCKAIKGGMSLLYVIGNTVRSLTTDGQVTIEFQSPKLPAITDMDVNIRQNKLYLTSAETHSLLQVDAKHNVINVTNIGKPTKVAVDWVTGNVYFVDNTTSDAHIRVCHIDKRVCAVLQKLPSNSDVTALIVDPSSHRMFYCVTRELESVVWTASLTGAHVTDLATVRNCTGLAVNSFNKKLYVAETDPAHILRMDYEGDSHKKILAGLPQLQNPQGIVLFEDHIYYQVANTGRIARCLTYGPKTCESYTHRVFNTSSFVIRHESVQRDDLVNKCDGVFCTNLCTLDENGAKCICDSGTFAKKNECPSVKNNLLALFNGLNSIDQSKSKPQSILRVVLFSLMTLMLLYVLWSLYYRFIHKATRGQMDYAEVRFQNGPTTLQSPEIEIVPGRIDISHRTPLVLQASVSYGDHIPPEGPYTYLPSNPANSVHEFVNPLQFLRNAWTRSIRKRTNPTMIHHIAIPPPAPDCPPQEDVSDTESDLDTREKRNMLL